mgnify:CR=1 FL=1
MDNMNDEDRLQTMQRDVLLVATAGVSLVNGMNWSPVVFPFYVLLNALFAGTFLTTPLVMTYLASLLASATTLVLGGVPAALYERATGLEESTPVSLAIWLAGTIFIVAMSFVIFPS